MATGWADAAGAQSIARDTGDITSLLAARIMAQRVAVAQQQQAAMDTTGTEKVGPALANAAQTDFLARRKGMDPTEDRIQQRDQGVADLKFKREQETRLSAADAETASHNVADEAITDRHNRAGEAIDLKRIAAATQGVGSKQTNASDIAGAIVSGSQPPDLARLYGLGAPVRAELARKGYNLTQATEDWNATSKYLATLNGPAQTRLRQAVDFTDESLGKVEDLAKQWKSSGLGPLSRGALTAAAQGAAGPQAQSLATRFQAQIADVTSELGTVYKGGNSSTDESLALAAKNLQADWSEKALLDNVAQIRTNLGYRRNSLRSAGVAGASADNPYAPAAAAPGTGAAGSGTGASAGPAIGTQRTINGGPAVWDGHGWIPIAKP